MGKRGPKPRIPADFPQVVRDYLDGKTTRQLEKDYRMKRRQIYRWMLSGVGDEKYHQLVTEALVNRISDADESLEVATDPIEVQKWREVARFARMDFERRRPALYGQKAVSVNMGAVVVDAALMDSMNKLLERVEPKLLETVIAHDDGQNADAG